MDKVSLLKKVVSGGQTGVDQAALRAAVKGELTIAGWCPPGMSSEAGLIPAEFPLSETPKERSELAPEVPRSLRTEWNVRDSNATLILQPSAINSRDLGTAFTLTSTLYYQRPVLICDPYDPKSVKQIKDWIRANAYISLRGIRKRVKNKSQIIIIPSCFKTFSMNSSFSSLLMSQEINC